MSTEAQTSCEDARERGVVRAAWLTAHAPTPDPVVHHVCCVRDCVEPREQAPVAFCAVFASTPQKHAYLAAAAQALAAALAPEVDLRPLESAAHLEDCRRLPEDPESRTTPLSQNALVEQLMHNAKHKKRTPYSLFLERRLPAETDEERTYTHVSHDPLFVLLDLFDAYDPLSPCRRSLPCTWAGGAGSGAGRVWFANLIVVTVEHELYADTCLPPGVCETEDDDPVHADRLVELAASGPGWRWGSGEAHIGSNRWGALHPVALSHDPRRELSSLATNALAIYTYVADAQRPEGAAGAPALGVHVNAERDENVSAMALIRSFVTYHHEEGRAHAARSVEAYRAAHGRAAEDADCRRLVARVKRCGFGHAGAAPEACVDLEAACAAESDREILRHVRAELSGERPGSL